MAKGRKKEDKPLYRAVRFEIRPTPEEVILLCRVSKNLSQVWNDALRQRQETFQQFLRPIYDRLSLAKKHEDANEEKALLAELKVAFKQERNPNEHSRG